MTAHPDSLPLLVEDILEDNEALNLILEFLLRLCHCLLLPEPAYIPSNLLVRQLANRKCLPILLLVQKLMQGEVLVS